MSEFRSNGKDAVTMLNIDNLKGHRSSAVNGIFSPINGVESAVTTERDKFKSTTVAAPIHCTIKGWVTTANIRSTFSMTDLRRCKV